MKVACLGWGSLIWKAGNLPLVSPWRSDGPRLPLEFCRESDGGELAIVLTPGAPATASYWAWMEVHDLAQARELLRQREQASPEHPEWIGSLPKDPVAGPLNAVEQHIASWMREADVQACVWTALPPRSKGHEGRKPSIDEAVAYLQGLSDKRLEHAKSYVRRVPNDIRTPYREAFEKRLGWRPCANAGCSADADSDTDAGGGK